MRIFATILITLASLSLMLGCGVEGDPDSSDLPQSQKVSSCGGFSKTSPQSHLEGGLELFAGNTYCDAEVLDWSYDKAGGKLTMSNNRVLLNCCGDHSISAKEVGGVVVVTEVDAPDSLGGRCGCMCVFDYALDLESIAPGTIQVRLDRHVKPGTPRTAWKGKIDLSKGSGSVVVDKTSVGMWCKSHPTRSRSWLGAH